MRFFEVKFTASLFGGGGRRCAPTRLPTRKFTETPNNCLFCFAGATHEDGFLFFLSVQISKPIQIELGRRWRKIFESTSGGPQRGKEAKQSLRETLTTRGHANERLLRAECQRRFAFDAF